MGSYVSAKKKEVFVSYCSICEKQKEIVSYIRNGSKELEGYCKICFEKATGKKVSKR